MRNESRTGIPAPPPLDASSLQGGGREAWNRRLTWLHREARSADPASFAREFSNQYREFNSALAVEEQTLLSVPLFWNDQEFALGRWIEGAFHAIAESSAILFRRLAEGSGELPPSGVATTVCGIALASAGSNTKWGELADASRRRTGQGELHGLYALAEQRGLADQPVRLPFVGEELTIPVTGLYARALLLGALCNGNLRRQQAAVIDGWLCEWVREYPITDAPVAGPHLRVGPSTSGLRSLVQGERSRVLSLDRMYGQIEEAVQWFHLGKVYPGHGPAVEQRVEEHVAAMDTLRKFLSLSRTGVPGRSNRQDRGEQVEVFRTLQEIIARGFSASTAAVETNAFLSPAQMAAVGKFNKAQKSALDAHYEFNARWMRLLDESETGLGFECDDALDPVEVGSLLAIRSRPGDPPIIAEVVRRIASPDARTRLGARVVSRDGRRVRLSVAGSRVGGVDCVFIPGQDSCGRGDSLLMPPSAYATDRLYRVAFPERTYEVRPTRIRQRGRGWIIAKVEVVGASEPEPVASIDFSN